MLSISSLSSNFDFFNSSRDIDFFNSNLSCSDFEIRQFNDVTSFLRNLEHCQKLYRYRRTKLLEYMLWVLNDFVWKWFKKRSHFNSLSRFDMILTETFFSQKQRELQSIIQKRAKRKARKIAKRAELNDIETAKQTSTFQNLDIFDSSLASDRFEFDLYSNVAIFLQHLEQCQHLYRKSNLLNLLSKCLYDHASDWFKIQSEFTSLKRFSKIITKTFSKTFVRRVLSSNSDFQLSTLDVISESTEKSTTCRHCDETFNFKKSFRDHKREQHRRKSIESSFLSINTLNSMCEDEKKSFVTHVSSASSAKFQNSIFESAATFRSVTSLERSNLSLSALETESKSTKKSATCRHCKQTFNFKKMFRQHKREQHAKRSVVNFHLSIDAVKSPCESMKISTVNSSSSVSFVVQSNTLSLFASFGIFNSNRFHQNLEKRRFNQIIIFIQHLQQCQFLCCESELLEWMKVILCDFVDIWFENQSNFIFLHDFDIVLTKTFSSNTRTLLQNEKKSIFDDSLASSESQTFIATLKQKSEFAMIFEAMTSLKNSHLSFSTSKIVSESMKNISIRCSAVSSKSASSQTFESKHQEISIQKTVISSSLRFHAFKSVCRAEEKSAIKNVTILSVSQELQISVQKNTKTISQIDSSKCSNLLITTLEITFEYAKNTSNSITEIAEAAEIFAKSIADIRAQTARIRARREVENSNLKLQTLNFTSKSMKRFSIQQIVCARICKRCKQSFNFNNKLHEHIREHHARKFVQNLNFRVPASESTCKIKKKSIFTCSSVSFASQKSFTFFATSRSQIFSTQIITQSLSSKCSNLSIATYKISSKSMKSAVVVDSLTSSSTSSHSHIQRFYLTANDLSRMFHEKSKSFDLRQHHNRRFFSQSFDSRQFSQSCFSISKKFYLTMNNLSRMFDGKFRKKNLFQHQMNVTFQTFSDQMRIIVYFKLTVNQKFSIIQSSKSSKSKSLNQHMFAKSIRTAFNESLFEKSIKLSYKMLDVFDIDSKIFFFIFILLRFLSIFFFAFAFVSIISAAKTNCISVYQQVISIIDHVSIEFVASRRSWEETRNKLLEEDSRICFALR